MSFLHYEDGVLDPSSIIPLIDGGTEGFKGNVRVIIPGMTACVECTLELYPPQVIATSDTSFFCIPLICLFLFLVLYIMCYVLLIFLLCLHQVNFPMCTIASMPRLPEHCIEYVRILQWPKEQPFGGN